MQLQARAGDDREAGVAAIAESSVEALNGAVRGRASEPRWPSVLAVLTAIGLYLSAPATMMPGASAAIALEVAVPIAELALLIPLLVTAPHRHAAESRTRRSLAICLTGILSTANMVALGFLVHRLVHGDVGGGQLLRAAGQVWGTNVIAFALWYWELDAGGPPGRLANSGAPRDFAFPQMTEAGLARPGWQPLFVDYLYLSFTNASAFSAADTLPLTAKAKLLMLLQSSISIVTLVLVAARAVNMLG
jgi:uncharacterized membrane protein